MTTPKEKLDLRVEAYNICNGLTNNQLKGLFLMVVGGHDCSRIDIWPQVEPLFIIKEGEQPIMHQDALVGMGDVAARRNRQKEVQSED